MSYLNLNNLPVHADYAIIRDDIHSAPARSPITANTLILLFDFSNSNISYKFTISIDKMHILFLNFKKCISS